MSRMRYKYVCTHYIISFILHIYGYADVCVAKIGPKHARLASKNGSQRKALLSDVCAPRLPSHPQPFPVYSRAPTQRVESAAAGAMI